MKDWTGNKASTFATLGASNHVEHDRAEYDYYATEPAAIDCLIQGGVNLGNKIWECACGENHLANRLRDLGYSVRGTDIIDRLHDGTIEELDFLNCHEQWNGDILTNPPYKFALEFTEKALELIGTGNKVYMFLKLTFLESSGRRKFFEENPPKMVYVFSNRILCGMNGDFYLRDSDGNIMTDKNGNPKKMSSAACYAWFEWEKGYQGEPHIKWIN